MKKINGFATVNGLRIYYEMMGEGRPLALIHGGGSTIETTFGRIMPLLAKHFTCIAMELQAHGHTPDRDAPLDFKQDADDVVALLDELKIEKADILGFSNGGQTTIEIALRHPNRVKKLIMASAFYKRSAVSPQFWDGFQQATLEQMPEPLKAGYLLANNDPKGLQRMFDRDVERMRGFTGWSDDQIRSIHAPTLVINGTHDVGSIEHAVEMYRTIPNAELAIFPGGHGTYLGTIESLENGNWPAFNATELIIEFLNKEK